MSNTKTFIEALNKKLSELTGANIVLKATDKAFSYSFWITGKNNFGVFWSIIQGLKISGYVQPTKKDDSEIVAASFDLVWGLKKGGSGCSKILYAEMDTDTGMIKYWDSTHELVRTTE